MIPTLTLLLAAQVPMGQPPRLRTQLPNGAQILVERIPQSKSLIVDLFISSKGTEDAPDTDGRRHLLEHIVALGPDGRLDERLETAGGFLTARTLRDSLEFEQNLPPNALRLGLDTLKQLLTPPTINEATIARESKIIEQEGALRENATRASAAAWDFAFGPNGSDPFGNLDVIRATKPAELAELRRRSFGANHLAIVVAGDIDLDQTTQAVADLVSLLPDFTATKDRLAITPQEGKVKADVQGEFRGVAVPGFRSPSTAATLSAALALSLQMPNAGVTYTPSSHPGLVILGASDGGLEPVIDKANAAQLFSLGRTAAIRWVLAKLADPQSEASCRGMLFVSERDLKPEVMLENLDALRFADFKAAMEAFKSRFVGVEGTR